jgi:hypothetical protein
VGMRTAGPADRPRPNLSGAALAERAAVSSRAAALAYAAAGWPVMPIAGIVNGVCACRRHGACDHPAKHPLIRGGTRGATTDPAQIDQWWRYWPTAGVGLLTGHRSGLAVVDVDPRHGGEATIGQLRERGFDLPMTLTAETGGGGRHLIYLTGGIPVGNTSGRLGSAGDTAGVDLRGDGGYIVAPPSRHISGGSYRWAANSPPPGRLPGWIAAPAPAPFQTPAVTLAPGAGYAARAIEGEVARVRTAPEGVRNDTLNRAAFSLGTLIGAGALDQIAAEDALASAAAAAGIPAREARRTIASGISSGITRPRTIEPTRPAPHPPGAGSPGRRR